MSTNSVQRRHLDPVLPLLAFALGVALIIGVAPAQATNIGGVVVQDMNAQLNDVDLNGTATLTPIGPTAGIEYNNIGFRRTDGFLYGVQLNGSGLTGGNNGIVRVNPNTGAVVNLGVPVGLGGGSDPLPTGAGSRFDAGDVTDDGSTLFISMGLPSNTPTGSTPQAGMLYLLDLPTFLANPLADALDKVTITGDAGSVMDWAYNPNDGLLYGGDQTNGQLAILNPGTGVRTDVNVTGLPAGISFGAAWWDTTSDTLFLYKNDGSDSTVYEIDVVAKSILESWDALGATRNDGAFFVPEPSTALLLGCGMLVLAWHRRRSS